GNEELMAEAKRLGAPYELLQRVAREGRLPVPSFAAGGIATFADAVLCMVLGAEAVFVGSGIFLSEDAPRRARAIVAATTYWQDLKKFVEVSGGFRWAMVGIAVRTVLEEHRFAPRGW